MLLTIWFVLVFAGAYFTLMPLASKYILGSIRPPKAIAPAPTPEPKMCELTVIRVFEDRLVDAGIIAPIEMSKCDDEECEECYPPEEKTSDVWTQRQRQLEYIKYKNGVTHVFGCVECGIMYDSDRLQKTQLCPTCMRERRERFQRRYEKCAVGDCIRVGKVRVAHELLCNECNDIRHGKEQKGRFRRYYKPEPPTTFTVNYINGKSVTYPRPEGVPPYAKFHMEYNPNMHCDRAVFCWTDIYEKKQMVAVNLPDYGDTIEIHDDHGNTTKKTTQGGTTYDHMVHQ